MMRYIPLILIALMCSVGSFAQSNKKVKQGTIDVLCNNLKNNAIDPLDNEIQTLQDKIESIRHQIEHIKDRKFTKSSGGGTVQELLSEYDSFSEIYKEKFNLLDQLEYDDSEMAHTYKLAIKMMESLDKVYDEKTNTELIEETSKYKVVLPQHQSEYNELVSMVNDYNYYMFELARLFVAADEDNYKSSAEALTDSDREDASYLMKVPYTKRVLEIYIEKGGNLPPTYKRALQNGCPDAFSELK